MTDRESGSRLRYDVDAVLLDIEGTIGSQRYVADVMFPYARQHLPDYVAAHRHDAQVRRALEETEHLAGDGADPVATLLRWIDEDRKAPPLKFLQGLVWDAGFRDGTLKGHIYPDALRALRRWRAMGIPLYIYSSGSVQAQKQFYRYNEAGDLSELFDGHYDTTMGPKVESASYQRIAAEIGVKPNRLLFLTDSERELEAACQAGLPVVQVVREGTVASTRFPSIPDLDRVELAQDREQRA